MVKLIPTTQFESVKDGKKFLVISRTTFENDQEPIVDFEDEAGNVYRNLKEETLLQKFEAGTITNHRLLNPNNFHWETEWDFSRATLRVKKKQ